MPRGRNLIHGSAVSLPMPPNEMGVRMVPFYIVLESVLALNVLSGGAGIALAISLGPLECLPTPHDRSIA